MTKPLVILRRSATEVTLYCLCTDEYAAMKLYDEMLLQIERGLITIELVDKE